MIKEVTLVNNRIQVMVNNLPILNQTLNLMVVNNNLMEIKVVMVNNNNKVVVMVSNRMVTTTVPMKCRESMRNLQEEI